MRMHSNNIQTCLVLVEEFVKSSVQKFRELGENKFSLHGKTVKRMVAC